MFSRNEISLIHVANQALDWNNEVSRQAEQYICVLCGQISESESYYFVTLVLFVVKLFIPSCRSRNLLLLARIDPKARYYRGHHRDHHDRDRRGIAQTAAMPLTPDVGGKHLAFR